MKRKRFLALLVSASMAVAMLSGCGSSQKAAEVEAVPAEEESETAEPEESEPVEKAEESETKELVAPDGFPKKTITLVVPVAAGGTFDMAARKIAECAKSQYDVDIVVENLPGGSGVVGMSQVLANGADGYTIALYSSGFYGNVAMGRFPEFTPDTWDTLTRCQTEGTYLCVSADSGIKNFEDLKEAILAGGFSVGGSGSLNNLHIGIRMLSEQFFGEGNYDDIIWTSYDGGSRIAADLLGNSVISAGILNPGELIGPYESGDIIPILNLSDERSEMFPDAITLEEAGYENVPLFSGVYNSSLIYAPSGIDEEIRQYLQDLLVNILNSDEFQEYITSIYATSVPLTGEELKETMDEMSVFFFEAKDTYLKGLL